VITCPACSKQIPLGSRFCAYCGGRLPTRPVQFLQRVDWPFLARWLGVTALGWGIAWLVLTHPLLARVANLHGNLPLNMAIAGAIVGAAQWPVLRQRPQRQPRGFDARWWMLATPAGWALAAYAFSKWPAFPREAPQLALLGSHLVPVVSMGILAGLLGWPAARHFAWPARGWALVPGVACAATVLVAAFEQAGGVAGGFFGRFAFGLGGRALVAWSDIVLAGTLGALVGLLQYFLVRRSVRLAFLWPVASALGMIAGALAADAANAVAIASWRLLGTAATLPELTGQGVLVAAAIGWGFAGAGLAGGQRALLRGSRLRAGASPASEWVARAWLPLSAAGWAAGSAAGWLLSGAAWTLLACAAAGLLAGLPQWLSVRRSSQSAIWLMPAAGGGWAALALGPLLPRAGPHLAAPALSALLGLIPGLLLAVRG